MSATMVSVRYRRPGGGSALHRLPLADLRGLLERLCRRRIVAEAEHDSGEWAGSVWLNERRWVWSCDTCSEEMKP